MSIDDSQLIHLYLCRHGQSRHNARKIVCGQIDSPLSEVGIRQAERLADSLNRTGIVFDRCYTSPLKRAAETARIVTGGMEIQVVPDLIEISAGSLSELTVSELNEKEPRYQFHGHHPDLRYPGGESLEDLRKRTVTWFTEEFSRAEKGKKYLLVAHWGSLNIILNHLFHIPIHRYSAFYLNNCELTHVTVMDETLQAPQMMRMNFT